MKSYSWRKLALAPHVGLRRKNDSGESAIKKKSTLRKHLLNAGVIVLVAAVIISLMLWSEKYNARIAEQYYAEERARQSAATAAYSRLGPGQALVQCRQQWQQQLSWSEFYRPQAFAWSRQGVDAYYLQGTDASSLRHFRCNPDGSVLRGKRYVRPGMDNLPAERTTEDADNSGLELEHALSAVPISNDLVALELYLAPDQTIAVRRWQGAEQLQAVLSPETADFPVLMQKPAPEVAGNALMALDAIAAHNWLREPLLAFAVLKRELPADAKVLKFRFNKEQISITIQGPIPAFDGDPPAASGDMEYDEYGVPDRTWWYPRPIFPNECSVGQPLDVVLAGFSAQWQPNTEYLWLIYDCKDGYSLRQPKRAR